MNGEPVSKLLSLAEVFKGRHFDAEIIVLCVRWYLQYKLSYRDLAEMMAERGIWGFHQSSAGCSRMTEHLTKAVAIN